MKMQDGDRFVARRQDSLGCIRASSHGAVRTATGMSALSARGHSKDQGPTQKRTQAHREAIRDKKW